MEFPNLGQNCTVPDCKTLDFLPIKCLHCNVTFCKNHCNPSSHNCDQVVDLRVTTQQVSVSFKCSKPACKDTTPVELICDGCFKNFCPTHRHHGCTNVPRVSKSAQASAIRKEFRKIKEETDKKVQQRLKHAKDRVLANKIKLMKMKGSAFGDSRIPVVDRVFFSVAPPLQEKEKSVAKCIFFNKEWTLGRTVDSAASRLKVDNKNNCSGMPQLTFFTVDGRVVSPVLDTTLATLISSGHLVDGDSLVLEYIPAQSNGSDINLDPNLLSKYVFTI